MHYLPPCRKAVCQCWGEGGVEATPVKELSCSPHCLRLPVRHTHISHLILSLRQPPPLGLFVCAYISAPAYVHTCALNRLRDDLHQRKVCLCARFIHSSVDTAFFKHLQYYIFKLLCTAIFTFV